MNRIFFVLLSLLTLLSSAPALAAEEEIFANWGGVQLLGDSRHHLDLAAGAYDFDNSDPAVAARVEARFGRKLGFLGPVVGFLGTTDGSYYGYLGVYADLALQRLLVTPLLGAGAFEDGSGKDLGGVLQFRSALTLACRLAGGSRLGLQFAHISNAETHKANPGENEILLSYAVPF